MVAFYWVPYLPLVMDIMEALDKPTDEPYKAGWGIMNIEIHGFNFCLKFQQEIDYDLKLNSFAKKCIEANNGCAYCTECVYRNILTTRDV